jgi:hypothetical protein
MKTIILRTIREGANAADLLIHRDVQVYRPNLSAQ